MAHLFSFEGSDLNLKINEEIIEKCCCGKKFLKGKINLHKLKCLYQFEICKFCELSVIRKDIKSHEYHCGSRTDNCLKCLVPVLLREMDVHVKYLCK